MSVVAAQIAPPPSLTRPHRRHPLLRLWRRTVRAVQNSIEVNGFLPDGTKDFVIYLRYPGASPVGRWFARWGWRFATHRLTRAGHWFFYVTLFLAMFGSITIEIQTYIPLLYALCFWGVAAAFVLVSRPNVSVRARHADVVSAGELLAIDAEVTSLRRGGLFPAQDINIVPMGLPAEIDAVPSSGAPVGVLSPGETAAVRLTLKAKKRGVYTLPGYRVETDFPFGLLNAYRRVETPSPLTVYPSFTPLEAFAFPNATGFGEGGTASLAAQGDSFEFWGNREWREGDSLRDIDWRATARLGGDAPVVREWREETFFRVGIVLDTFLARPTGAWRGVLFGPRAFDPPRTHRDALERSVSLAAALGDFLARHQYPLSLFAASGRVEYLNANRRTNARETILALLAGAEDTPKEWIADVETELLANTAQLSTIVCFFLEYDDRRRAFVELLRSTGVGVKVIVVPPRGKNEDEEDDSDEPAGVNTPEPDMAVVDARAFRQGVRAL